MATSLPVLGWLSRGRSAPTLPPRPPRIPLETTIFLHIPKTGGTSFRSLLLAQHDQRRTMRILDPRDDAKALRDLPVARRSSLTLIEGHMYFGIHEHLPGSCQYITIIRDPVDRVRSWYRYVRARPWHHLHGPIVDRNLGIAACCTQGVSVELDNFMTRSLSHERYIDVPFGAVTREMFELAAANLRSMFVLTTETLEEDARAYCQRSGHPSPAFPTLNRSPGPADLEDADPTTLSEVASRNEFDRQLHSLASTLRLGLRR